MGLHRETQKELPKRLRPARISRGLWVKAQLGTSSPSAGSTHPLVLPKPFWQQILTSKLLWIIMNLIFMAHN